MARRQTVWWIQATQGWRADAGPRSEKTGRRRPVYFRGLPNNAKGKRQAEDALEEFIRDRDRREEAEARSPGDPSVWQVIQAYLQHAEGTVEPRTVATHAGRLDVWMNRAPGVLRDEDGDPQDVRPARTLKPADLSRVAKAMTDEGLAAHYVGGVVASVKACWAWAARHEEDRRPQKIVAEDVFKDVKGPRIPQAPERYLPPGQAEALLAFIDAKAEAAPGLTGQFDRMTALLYRCLYESGARPSELCRATWRDFDAEAGVIVLKKHKTGEKVGKPRRIPLTGVLADRVKALRSRESAHPDFIFTHRRGRNSEKRGAKDAGSGEPWTVGPLGQKFRKLRIEATKAGIDVRVRDGAGQVPEGSPECTLYDFRRTFASDADGAGFTSGRTADAMGNSAVMVDRIYRTRQAKDAVAVAEAIAEGRKRRQD